MKKMLIEFKEFAMKGNVIDLAVGVVIGTAFGKIVTSLVDNIIMPLVGVLMGGLDFSGLAINVGKATVRYGGFIQAIMDFLIVAFVIFSCIKWINSLKKEKPAEPAAAPVVTPSEEYLKEIRDLLKAQKENNR